MKKFAMAAALTLLALFCFAGCSAENGAHTHTFAETWSYNESTHWHAATCGHTDVRGEEAAHVLENGKCTVCAYKAQGMSVTEFTENYAEKGRDFARSAVKELNLETVLSEFVWFKTDGKNFLTGFTYLYTASRGEGQSPSHMLYRVTNDGFSPLDLQDVAEGKTAQMGTAFTSGSLLPYEKDAQTESAALAEKVLETYFRATGETADGGTPLLRLFHAQTRSSGGIDLRVLDVMESGYVYYIVNVEGTESEVSDYAALTAKLQGVNKESCKKNGKTDLGTLVYQNVKG